MMRLFLVLVFFTAHIAGCSVRGQEVQEPGAIGLDTRELFSQPEFKGDKALALDEGRWLLSSETHGLLIIDGDGRIWSQVEGNYESLDLRGKLMLDGVLGDLVSAVNQESGAVELFRVGGETTAMHPLAQIAAGQAQPEAQCLYQDPDEMDISIFIADATGMVSQRVVYDSQRQLVVDIPVRNFIGAPGAEACTVDDLTKTLYLAEESVGVWRYPTDPERELVREPVLLRQPHGPLAGDVLDVAMEDDGSLWVLDDEAALHRVSVDGRRQAYLLKDMDEPETLSVARRGNSVSLAIYDEGDAGFRQAGIGDYPPVSRRVADAMPRVMPSAETGAVARFGDAADDPVVWVNAREPQQSLVIGTDKREGLKIYSLAGELVQSLPVGRVNNVDLREDVAIEGRRAPLIAASNRTHNSISLFTLDSDARIAHLGEVETNLTEVYGLCMYQSESGNYVFVNDTDGRYQQYRIDASVTPPKAELVREFTLPSQPEGCAADDGNQRLYMGEEAAGIWLTDAEPTGGAAEMIISTGEQLVADVEGMDIYYGEERNYLVVSSQGNDSYLVFGLWDDYPLLTRFRVTRNLRLGIDGASETDGLAVTSSALPGYPQGLLVVQDGRNQMPHEPQNFKLISWESISALLP